jgi:hypothetical protein
VPSTSNIKRTDQSDSNTTCHDAHIIPAEEYLVNNAPTLDNQETTPENGTETTVENPESLKAFEAGHHPTETLKAFEAGLPEDVPDQNPSATNSTPKNSATNTPESATNTPENGMKPTIKNTEDCIKTLQQLEDCLPQSTISFIHNGQRVACYNDNASRLTWQERASARKIAVDPLTMKWQFEDANAQVAPAVPEAQPGFIQTMDVQTRNPSKTPGHIPSTQVPIWLQWQSLTATMARKRVSK